MKAKKSGRRKDAGRRGEPSQTPHSQTPLLGKKDFCRLAQWFEQNGVHYPWYSAQEDSAPNPYAVWVSEVMLQQTTIGAVKNRYQSWMKRFPSTAALSTAGEDEVLREWEGLGYYARARNLAAAARKIHQSFNGEIPQTPDLLKSLPGVGDYTAAAIASFAFGARTAAIDANGKRIAMRLSATPEWNRSLEKNFRSAIEEGMLHKSPRIINAAIMQLGQLVCLPGTPRCEECPLSKSCRAWADGVPEKYPSPAVKKIINKTTVLALLHRKNSMFLVKRTSGIGKGLWVFPEESAVPGLRNWIRLADLPEKVHTYTRYRDLLKPRLYREKTEQHSRPCKEGEWIDLSAVQSKPMPTAYRKVMDDCVEILLNPAKSGRPV